MKFQLGQLAYTPDAADALGPIRMAQVIAFHASGDWGTVCDEDKATNDLAVKVGNRILSAYTIDPSRPALDDNNTVWVITEADRSVTTVLMPDEY